MQSHDVAVGYLNAGVEDAVLNAALRDDRFSPDTLEGSVREVVAAWARAAEGDEAALSALATPAAIRALLYPAEDAQRVMVRGLAVRGVVICGLDAGADPPLLRVTVSYAGRRAAANRDVPPAPQGFADFWELTLDGAAPCPWRLAGGRTRTDDEIFGYPFTIRRETAQEYLARTGSLPGQAAQAAGQQAADGELAAGQYQIDCGFVEHDVKFGSSAAIVVTLAGPPDRQQAAQLVRPAIEARLARFSGPADYQPSILRLEVRKLLD